MYNGSIKNKQRSFSSFLQGQEKRAKFWSQQGIEWVVLWEALIRGSSQNIVILLLVLPVVRMSPRDYLIIYDIKIRCSKM